jgi:uncharacterized membrane protein
MTQPRYKSWAVWLSILPVIVLLGDTYNLWNVIKMPQDTFTKVFVGIGAVLVGFGVLNNPTDPNKF